MWQPRALTFPLFSVISKHHVSDSSSQTPHLAFLNANILHSNPAENADSSLKDQQHVDQRSCASDGFLLLDTSAAAGAKSFKTAKTVSPEGYDFHASVDVYNIYNSPSSSVDVASRCDVAPAVVSTEEDAASAFETAFKLNKAITQTVAGPNAVSGAVGDLTCAFKCGADDCATSTETAILSSGENISGNYGCAAAEATDKVAFAAKTQGSETGSNEQAPSAAAADISEPSSAVSRFASQTAKITLQRQNNFNPGFSPRRDDTGNVQLPAASGSLSDVSAAEVVSSPGFPFASQQRTVAIQRQDTSGSRSTSSLRRSSVPPVVPHLRILLLFGSTSGTSASVAFSLFHSIVHRLRAVSTTLQPQHQELLSSAHILQRSTISTYSARGSSAAVAAPVAATSSPFVPSHALVLDEASLASANSSEKLHDSNDGATEGSNVAFPCAHSQQKTGMNIGQPYSAAHSSSRSEEGVYDHVAAKCSGQRGGDVTAFLKGNTGDSGMRLTGGPQQQEQERNSTRGQVGKKETGQQARMFLTDDEGRLSAKRVAAAQAAEMAFMGLHAAGVIADTALRDAEIMMHEETAAAAEVSEGGRDRQELPCWFLDKAQIGRVGVYIQSMQYFTLQNLLAFVEESRSVAVTAPFSGAGAAVECSAVLGESPTAKLPSSPFKEENSSISCSCSTGASEGASSVHSPCFCSPASVAALSKASTSAGSPNHLGGHVSRSSPHTILLFCLSTHIGGTPPESAAPFYTELIEAAVDFRVSRCCLDGCCVAAVGCGSTDYPNSTFCLPAKKLLRAVLSRLGGQPLLQQALLTLTDTTAAATMEMKLSKWRQQLLQQLEMILHATEFDEIKRLTDDARRGFHLRQRQQIQKSLKSNVSKPAQKDDGSCDEVRLSESMCEMKTELIDEYRGGGSLIDGSSSAVQSSDLARVDTLLTGKYQVGQVSENVECNDIDEYISDSSDSDFSSGENSVSQELGSGGCSGSANDDVEEVVPCDLNEYEQSMRSFSSNSGSNGDIAAANGDVNVSEEERYMSVSISSGAAAVARSRGSQQRPKLQAPLPDMVSDKQAKQLRKEGYKLIGSHSAVKLCRWTKSQLRGRGGCYKHTFYGITSSQCMEMTPSLACANKCIFCWRHHKNPVGTSWRWKMDSEEVIVEEALKQHFKAIKELKGMLDVKQSRLQVAQKEVRHCALSLVGEPIMYPEIAQLVRRLHQKHISTFLVTNAQFPDALASLPPVTQLYLSIDAASPQDLKRLDQPLFADYWERFITSMDILKKKRQRTVYRLTLVAGYNMPDVEELQHLDGGEQQLQRSERQNVLDDAQSLLKSSSQSSETQILHSSGPCGNVADHLSPMHSINLDALAASSSLAISKKVGENRTLNRKTQILAGRTPSAYAALVSRGCPDLIEVKAVTYAGSSKHSKLTMKNIPWHEQVVSFCKALCAALPTNEYELACEHRHSCCILIAKTSYKIRDKWHTWIDYERFYQLAASGRNDYTGLDYCALTPDWAVYGNQAEGFSPFESRIYGKGKNKRLMNTQSEVAG